MLELIHKSFVQADTIVFSVHNQTCRKYPTWHVCIIFKISQERPEAWSWFSACRWTSNFPTSWYCQFCWVWSLIPKVPKIINLLIKLCYGNNLHLGQCSRMDQVNFVEYSLQKIWRDMVCLSRPNPFKFFKGCLLQILLGPSLNTLSHLSVENYDK